MCVIVTYAGFFTGKFTCLTFLIILTHLKKIHYKEIILSLSQWTETVSVGRFERDQRWSREKETFSGINVFVMGEVCERIVEGWNKVHVYTYILYNTYNIGYDDIFLASSRKKRSRAYTSHRTPLSLLDLLGKLGQIYPLTPWQWQR